MQNNFENSRQRLKIKIRLHKTFGLTVASAYKVMT